MTAAQHDIRVEAGNSFRLDAQWKDEDGNAIDLTDHIGRAVVRRGERRNGRNYPDVESDPLITFTVSFPDPAEGRFRIEGSPEDTYQSAYSTWPDFAVWDCELENPSGDITRLLEGRVEIAMGVS